MVKTVLIFTFILASLFGCSQNPKSDQMEERKLTYLALGDSYTIGESVEEDQRYPNQLMPLLEQPDAWDNPRIIAKTGWTVDELDAGINEAEDLSESYDLVTLLIGVNNQYRGRPVEDYAVDFEKMLLRAIGFAGDLPNHVVVLSIPDWGVTPFATSRGTDKEKNAAEIDEYNQKKKEICDKYGVAYIDITEEYRVKGALPEGVASDGLHPSGAIYADWAEKLSKKVNQINF
ncbi:SGNH/GDSL hydrolase family protein [Algoriphagus sp. C2-7]|uniref:SGNH/GDSL hydrolase family protein n=2 Tax=Algoriphagus sediminis TaxID=3057113 RepID=A0ABT7YAD3_9BACT|nr:SGNH/GDSL hydrolase family protein [Algoriphagus sediminis]